MRIMVWVDCFANCLDEGFAVCVACREAEKLANDDLGTVVVVFNMIEADFMLV